MVGAKRAATGSRTRPREQIEEDVDRAIGHAVRNEPRRASEMCIGLPPIDSDCSLAVVGRVIDRLGAWCQVSKLLLETPAQRLHRGIGSIVTQRRPLVTVETYDQRHRYLIARLEHLRRSAIEQPSIHTRNVGPLRVGLADGAA